MFHFRFCLLPLLTLLLITRGESFAQKIELKLDNQTIQKELKYKRFHDTQEEARVELNQLLFKLRDKGYLASSIDSSQFKNNKLIGYIHIGALYKWVTLRVSKQEEWLFNSHLFKEKDYLNKVVSLNDWNDFQRNVIEYLENNGYPFASIYLDSVVIDTNLEARINVQRNELIRIDSIELKGLTSVSKNYLYHYLGIFPGDLYKEKLIESIDEAIEMLPFINMTSNKEVLFEKNKATIKLNLNDNMVSHFNAVLGVLPDGNISSRLVLTGDVLMNIENPWGGGRKVFLNWRRLNATIQELDAFFNNPYLLNSSVGANIGIKIFKDDSSFLNVKQKTGVQYLFRGDNYLEAFIEINQSNVIHIDTNYIVQYRSLPEQLDASTYFYGVEWKQLKYDYKYNPRKGYGSFLNFAIGSKEIKTSGIIRNLKDINGDDFSFLYDSIELKTNTYRIAYDFNWYFPLGKIWIAHIQNKGGKIFNKHILENELYRLGGLNSLRGFDESSILVSSYYITTLESKWMLDKDSYFYLFSDFAYWFNEVNLRDNDSFNNSDRPISIGAGVNFKTKAGIFAINYAIGKQFGNPFNIKGAKIHLGYINYF